MNFTKFVFGTFLFIAFVLSLGPVVQAQTQAELIARARARFQQMLPQLPCDAPVNDFPNWENLPVTKCSYTDVGVTTRTYMLNPSADQLARWAVTACQDAHAHSMNACVSWLARQIREASSGGIFPVAGYIVEPASSGGGHGNAATCYLFRDGLTIRTATWHTQPAVNGKCGPDDENQKPATRAFRYARIASTTREDYKAAGGTEPVGTTENLDVGWLKVVRTLYKEAWTNDRNQLLTAKARAGKSAGAFH
ncbi:MAG TPA: hypothetical protein VHQ64_00700 [Pyrinomonadaceae bacterium]|nr:hypothetical protein [Pyrinomonadaceae bacterium]